MHKDAEGKLWVDGDDLARQIFKNFREQPLPKHTFIMDRTRWDYTKIGSCDDGTFESTVAMLERHAKK